MDGKKAAEPLRGLFFNDFGGILGTLELLTGPPAECSVRPALPTASGDCVCVQR